MCIRDSDTNEQGLVVIRTTLQSVEHMRRRRTTWASGAALLIALGTTGAVLSAGAIARNSAQKSSQVFATSSAEEMCIRDRLYAGPSGNRVGVLELYLPYAPIAADVSAELRTLYLDLALGLGGLYLLLLSLIHI